MMDSQLSSIDAFLGFPFLDWLHKLPLPRLFQLSRLLMSEKLLNWAMLRTITNVFDSTQEFRTLLSRDQQLDFMEVESSIRKSSSEEAIWLQAVVYLMFRNILRLLRAGEAVLKKMPELDFLLSYRRKQLEQQVSPLLLKQALHDLYTDKKAAYSCYTALGSQQLALALSELSDEAIRNVLAGSVSANFIRDILQLKNGDFLLATPYRRLAAKDSFLEQHARLRIGKNLKLESLLVNILKLPPGPRHACLFAGNLIDLGYLLKDEANGAALMAIIKTQTHPVYSRLVQAAMEDRLKLNRLEPDALDKLAIQHYRLRRLIALSAAGPKAIKPAPTTTAASGSPPQRTSPAP